MEVSTTKLNRIDSMENEKSGVLIGGEDTSGTELLEPFGVQTHGGIGQPSGGFARNGIGGDKIRGDARVAEAERMDLEGGGDVVAGL